MKRENNIIFAQVSKNATDIYIDLFGEWLCYSLNGNCRSKLPEDGKWVILGDATKLTVEQKILIHQLDPSSFWSNHDVHYNDLRKRLKIYDVNPLGKEPKKYQDSGPEMQSTPEWKEWAKEQSHVDRYIVLVNIENIHSKV